MLMSHSMHLQFYTTLYHISLLYYVVKEHTQMISNHNTIDVKKEKKE